MRPRAAGPSKGREPGGSSTHHLILLCPGHSGKGIIWGSDIHYRGSIQAGTAPREVAKHPSAGAVQLREIVTPSISSDPYGAVCRGGVGHRANIFNRLTPADPHRPARVVIAYTSHEGVSLLYPLDAQVPATCRQRSLLSLTYIDKELSGSSRGVIKDSSQIEILPKPYLGALRGDLRLVSQGILKVETQGLIAPPEQRDEHEAVGIVRVFIPILLIDLKAKLQIISRFKVGLKVLLSAVHIAQGGYLAEPLSAEVIHRQLQVGGAIVGS